jgi:hypothetical protein
MGRYRKIDTRIWNDEKFSLLPDGGKLIFLFLLTHPHMTSLGAMRATIPGLAAELGWEEKPFRKGFETLSKGLVEHSEKASYIGIPNFLKYNPPENPNVVKSWAAVIDLLPECDLKYSLLERVKGLVERLPEPFRNAFETVCQTISKRARIPEPEPEPEPDKEEAEAEMTIITKSGREFPITKSAIDLWVETYPHVDVRAKLLRMKSWSVANVGNRKTETGMMRFIDQWLAGDEETEKNKISLKGIVGGMGR